MPSPSRQELDSIPWRHIWASFPQLNPLIPAQLKIGSTFLRDGSPVHDSNLRSSLRSAQTLTRCLLGQLLDLTQSFLFLSYLRYHLFITIWAVSCPCFSRTS